MAIRNIVKEGDPILNKVCRPVTTFDDRLATLLDDMHETMIAADGVGLAGPQVGMLRRLFVCGTPPTRPRRSPKITNISSSTSSTRKFWLYPRKRRPPTRAVCPSRATTAP